MEMSPQNFPKIIQVDREAQIIIETKEETIQILKMFLIMGETQTLIPIQILIITMEASFQYLVLIMKIRATLILQGTVEATWNQEILQTVDKMATGIQTIHDKNQLIDQDALSKIKINGEIGSVRVTMGTIIIMD